MTVELSVEESRDRQIEQLQDTIGLFQERIAELEFAQEDIGWERLGTERNYEFSRDHLRRIIARARLFFLQNPLINRAVTLQADYVYAQGVNAQGNSDVINKVIQDFIDDPTNQLEFTSHQANLLNEQTLMIDGNVFFVLFTDKINTGHVKVRSILVDEIKQIITNPDDASEVWFYKREWTPVDEEGYSQTLRTAYYPDINYMPIKGGEIVLPKSRNGETVYWDAPILHIKVGSLKKAKYGTPEIYSALEWAQAHKKMLQNWATIVEAYARFAFRFTTPGGKNSVRAVTQRLGTTVGSGLGGESNPTPVAGSMFVRSKDGVDIEPIKTAGATTSPRDARELRIMVAAAVGLPDPMLSGEVDVGNLATAKTLDRPTELKFRSRQKVWEQAKLKVFEWVIRWAIEAPNGMLTNKFNITYDRYGNKIYKPKRDPKTKKPYDQHVEVVFPPILERTIQERIDAITGAVTLNGKTFAVDSPELKKLTIRLMLQALGISDVDEHVENIFAMMTDDDLKDKPEDKNEPEVEPEPESEPEPVEVSS